MKTLRNVVVSAVLLVVAVKMFETGSLLHMGGQVGSGSGGGVGSGGDNRGGVGFGANVGGTIAGSPNYGVASVAGSAVGGAAGSAVGGSAGSGVGSGAGADVTVPGMNSGYPCELGELGKPGAYENKKEFWGDDSISQGLKRASDAVGNSTRDSIRESARKLGVSL